jgi:hypothetical protein
VTERSDPRPVYSPARRTALVLTGSAADGAYHAGVLRALHEAGIRLDLVAGHGIGAVGALFAAIDGSSRLWEAQGLWRRPEAQHVYRWRTSLRVVGWTLLAGALLVVVPLAVLALGLVVYQIAVLLEAAGSGAAGWLASGYTGLVAAAFRPAGLPTWLPRLAFLAIVVVTLTVAGAGVRALWAMPARRRQRGGPWWAALGAPIAGGDAARYFHRGLWELIRGGARIEAPEATDLGRRYGELLAENLGQPGFRELLIMVHDLDARRDLVFALLGHERRREFFLRRAAVGTERRAAEAFDLAGVARDHTLHAVAGALALPVASEPALLVFSSESYWRGEAHRLTGRPEGVLRLLEEVAAAGAEQVILVTASAELEGPHGLTTRRPSPRARLGEFLASAQAAAVRDALLAARGGFEALYVVRPAHNPLTPLDLGGVFDERSDRRVGLGELVDRGYDDAYRQFIEPVVGASGEALEAGQVLP